MVRVRIRFSVWLISSYAHVFMPLSVVIVTRPLHARQSWNVWAAISIYLYIYFYIYKLIYKAP